MCIQFVGGEYTNFGHNAVALWIQCAGKDRAIGALTSSDAARRIIPAVFSIRLACFAGVNAISAGTFPRSESRPEHEEICMYVMLCDLAQSRPDPAGPRATSPRCRRREGRMGRALLEEAPLGS